MRFRRVADSVVELGDVTLTDDSAEPEEAPGLFGDRDGKDRLALLAVVGALCHKSQTREVHVCAAGDSDESLVDDAGLLNVFLHTSNCERSCGLEERPGVGKDVFDRSACFVSVDNDDVVDVLLGQPERLLANLFHCGAIGEQPDLIQRDDVAGAQRVGHGR